MSASKEIQKEIKQIMYKTTLRTVTVAGAVVFLVLVLADIFDYESNTSPFIAVLLIIGTTTAIIGNGFVAEATTRWNAKESMLWIWGNRVQAIGFVITLAAALL